MADGITRREAATMISRALALLVIVWALNVLTYLPQVAFALQHHLQQRSVLEGEFYLADYYKIDVGFYVVRFLGLTVAGVWLWKWGGGLFEAACGD